MASEKMKQLTQAYLGIHGYAVAEGDSCATILINDIGSFGESLILRCVEIATQEGVVPQEEGGNLSRWDACDNVARAILAEFGMDRKE